MAPSTHHTPQGPGSAGGESPLLTPLHDDISILTVLLSLMLLPSVGRGHRVQEERFDVSVDGRGLVVGQKELDVGEHGVLEDVVFASGGIAN